MNAPSSRRKWITRVGLAAAAAAAAPAVKATKATVQKVLVKTEAPPEYDPTKHKWQMAFDVNRCIGCGHCVEACKEENHVPEGPYYRTWIERYIVRKPEPGSVESRGEVRVDSPDGGRRGASSADILSSIKRQLQRAWSKGYEATSCRRRPGRRR